MSTPPTAASIVTASKSAPITPRPISIGSGASAAAPRAIIFLIARCCSAKCAWAPIFPTSVNAHPPKKRTHRLLRARVPRALPPQRHLLLRQSRPQLHPQIHLLLLRLPLRLLQSQRILPLHRHLLLRRPDRRPHHCLRHQFRSLGAQHLRSQRKVRVLAPSPHVPRRARLAWNQNPESHRHIQRPGIIDIFIRRAASQSIRTCRLIAFFMRNAALPGSGPPMRSISPDPTRRLLVGKLFRLTTRTVSSPI